MFKQNIDDLIDKYKLKPHPFGCGFFSETYRASQKTNIGTFDERNLSTTIIALFKSNQINELHRTKSHQIIHYYPSNSSLLVHVIDNGNLRTYKMPDETIQLQISPLTWFAMEVEDKNENSFVLTGHTVTPGFDFKDFEQANRTKLQNEYPHLSNFINLFTRDEEICESKSFSRVSK